MESVRRVCSNLPLIYVSLGKTLSDAPHPSRFWLHAFRVYRAMSRNIYFTMMPANRTRPPREERLTQEEYWACITIPVLFWLFVSLTLALGIYGSKLMVLGPNYSQVLDANSLLVTQIEVTERHEADLMLYSFSVRPVLGQRSTWKETHNFVLEADYHQEFGMWLNMGSKIHITCFIRSSGFYSIVLTVSEGYSGLQEWIQDPTNAGAAAAWKDVHGQVGVLEYEVQEDGDYFIAVGNLNQQSVAIELQLDVNATMYNFESSDSQCSLANGSCKVTLPFFGNRYALLTSPPFSENVTGSWEVELYYGVRWLSYITVLVCVLLLVLATLTIVNKVSHNSEEGADEDGMEEARSALLSTKDAAADASSSDLAAADDEDTVHFQNEDTYDAQLCVICLDAPKTVFFIPCGHCATCLPCGQRVRHCEAGTCPICRVKIEKIRRVFQA